jgi:serine kinase of HPr protein (carbohydrate metabolism regulator)
VTSATVEHLYLNQVLPLALSRQGKLVLHGSAVDIGGQGVAFLGESGRGKSTLAASFATEGTRFLTDDGLLLEWVGECCMIIPSHPSIRLWQTAKTR